MLNSLEEGVKRILNPTFEYVLDNMRFGYPEPGTRAENFSIFWFTATTSSVANTEFSIEHGLNVIPVSIHQSLPGDVVGASLVNLTTTRAADGRRVYLSSPSTSAVIYVGLEIVLLFAISLSGYGI